MAKTAGTSGRAAHWDGAYAHRGVEGVSWHQLSPGMSLTLIERLGISRAASVIDVGAGASFLADELVRRGFSDVTVLDVSRAALSEVERRLPATPALHVVQADCLEWSPDRLYDLWHDRALLHFLVDEGDRSRYVETLLSATAPGAGVILGTFAPDAPRECSGLPVRRYSTDDLVELLGRSFELVEARREEHVTPRGAVQPFAWVAGRLRDRAVFAQ